MILRTIYCLIFISTTFSFILNGQDHQKIDSLQQLLKVPSIDLHTEADIYTQLSKLLIAHYPDSSYIYVTKALALAIELEDTYLMCKTYTNSSLMDINHARYESAINKLNKADSLTYKIDTIKHDPNDILKGRKVILQNRSIAFQYLNDIESSIRDNLESLKICETIKDSFGISLQYFNLAHAHNSLDNKIRTKKYLDQALRMARKINYPFVISGSLIFKCSLLTEEQKLDSIKIYALEALEIANQNNNFQNRIEASRLLGIAYIEEDSLFLANKILKEVLESSRSIKSSFYEAGTLVSLGLANKKLGKYATSKDYYNQFFKLNETLDNTHLKKQALYEFADLEQITGNYRHANELLEEYYVLQDSIFTEENRRITSDLDAKYEAAKKDAELTNQQATIDKQSYQRNLLIGVGLLSLLFAGFIWNRKYTSEKIYSQQKELDTQKINQLEKEKKILAMNAMLEGQEAERMRIAKDLHDGLGGLLSTVKARLSNINSEVKKIESYNIYEKTTSMVDEACDEVRRISHNLLPGALRLDGLKTAVEQLGEDLTKSHPFVVNVEVLRFDGKLEETKEIFLYRIIQEATNNIIKHANAKQVLIQLSETDNEYHIIIEDDGVGFDVGLDNSGLGLKSMRSRVEHMQGELDCSSKKNQGTTISIHVPKTKV